MMEQTLRDAFTQGYERLVCWADLIDAINVFPVRDADTGRNLRITLSCLRQSSGTREEICKKLLLGATGNSGNIAAVFFSSLVTLASKEDLLTAFKTGRDRAYSSVMDPKPGTMLTIFDQLVESLEEKQQRDKISSISLINDLTAAVRSTPELLPPLKTANVVDAGALAIFIYMEGFFKCIDGSFDNFLPILDIFKGGLSIQSGLSDETTEFCISSLVHLKNSSEADLEKISRSGHSVVVNSEESSVKVHIHTEDKDSVRTSLSSMGEIIQWSEERIQVDDIHPALDHTKSIHIMTDAAGSVTAGDARRYGMTLLDSYIVTDESSVPETLCPADDIYMSMIRGARVSTAQASLTERGYCYARAIEQYDRVLYLCTGSVYTGNFDTVCRWKEKNDPQNRLMVIDTGAASGRLGLAAIATARHALKNHDLDEVTGFAKWAVENCEEYIFLDRLKYLVRGGRLSKTKGFFGDLVRMKPIISPLAGGAKRIGSAGNADEQIAFAMKKLRLGFGGKGGGTIMLEYSDNKSWVQRFLRERILEKFPDSHLIMQPLSLTSGVHMGPGTWAIAFLPRENESERAT